MVSARNLAGLRAEIVMSSARKLAELRGGIESLESLLRCDFSTILPVVECGYSTLCTYFYGDVIIQRRQCPGPLKLNTETTQGKEPARFPRHPGFHLHARATLTIYLHAKKRHHREHSEKTHGAKRIPLQSIITGTPKEQIIAVLRTSRLKSQDSNHVKEKKAKTEKIEAEPSQLPQSCSKRKRRQGVKDDCVQHHETI